MDEAVADGQDAALRAANARLELLGRASTVLASSLELEQTLAGFADLMVPGFADHCLVDLFDDDGRLVRAAARNAPGAEAADRAWTRIGQVADYRPGHPVAEVLATGREVLVTIDPDAFDYRAVAPSADSARAAQEIRVRCALSIPLSARGHLVGVASFTTSLSGRVYRDDDVRLARQLADRAAVAIDNARLYGREQRHALTLQRRLMPDRLPAAPGVLAAARYLPAADGGQVGGDWYDLIPLVAGRVAIVIGDVMGRGVPAAALMGQVRAALRAYAVQDLPPAEVFCCADEFVGALDEGTLVTCVYAVYDPRESTLTVANAGHVPPLLLGPDGRVAEQLDATGLPLGTGLGDYRQVSLPFHAEQLLALYTDGLVETRAEPIDVGIDRLVGLITSVQDLEAGCDAALGSLDRTVQNDDVALLLVRPDPRTRPPTLALGLLPDAREASRARAVTAETLRAWVQPEELVDVAELIVSELVANVVEHAGTRGLLTLSLHEDGIVVEVRDERAAPPRRRRAGPEDENGRGVMLVSSLSVKWGVRSLPDGAGKAVWCRLEPKPDW
jgi:anti-sigma regulatory factor (Ser/Thr protein kinase)